MPDYTIIRIPGIRGPAGGTGGVTGVIASKTLYVDTAGSDVSGVRGRVDLPYLTLAGARDDAVSGDTIEVRPGSYNEKNLLKNGVNWHFSDGAIVSSTSASDGAIFDDSIYGANAAITCRITGSGQFIRNAGSGNHPKAPAVLLTNASSNLIIHADLIQTLGAGGNSDQTAPYGIRQAGGSLDVTARRISGDYGGVWWDNGECFIHVNEITVTTGIPAIYTSTGVLALDEWSAAYVSGFLWVDAQRIHNPSDATLRGDVNLTSDSAVPRVWITVKELAGFFTAAGAVGGRNYLNAQKARVVGLSAGENWVTVQKVQTVGGASLGINTVQCNGGTNYIAIQHVDHGGSGAIFKSTGGTNYLSGQIWTTTLNRDGIQITGGTTTVDGITVDVSANATSKNPVNKSGGTLVLKDVKLTANGSQESVFASSAQTVIRGGTIYANNAANGNITFSSAGTDLGGSIGVGDALMASPLSQFAATTSLQLKGVMSDETGSGALVFATSPTLVTPQLGTPASGILTNCTGLPLTGMASMATASLLGRSTAGTGDPEVLSASAARTMLSLVPGTNFLAYPTGTPSGTKFLRDDNSWQTITGGGDALVANPLSQFASTTSLQLKGVLSDETGSGALVFATSPTLVTPILGTPTSITLTNATGLPTAGVVDAAITLAKMANLAQDQFIGRTTASTGVPETTTITAAARTVLDDTTVGAMVNTLGGATATGTGGIARATSPSLVTPTMTTPIVSTAAASTFAQFDGSKQLVSSVAGTDYIAVTGTPAAGKKAVATSSSAAAWTGLVVKIATTTYTIGTTDPLELYGGVIYVTSACTLTIPAVVAGMHFTVITKGAIAVSVDPNASDLIIRDGTAQADGEKVTNTSTTGDMAVFTYYDATGFYCASNSWTNGG